MSRATKNKKKVDTLDTKTVFTVGCFDMLHEGHVKLLDAMGRGRAHVIVLLHDDLSIFYNKKRFPVQPYELRRENLLKSGLAHEVFPIRNPDPSEEIDAWYEAREVKGEFVYIRSDDMRDFPGKETVERLKIPIIFHPYTQGISSTKRRERAS